MSPVLRQSFNRCENLATLIWLVLSNGPLMISAKKRNAAAQNHTGGAGFQRNRHTSGHKRADPSRTYAARS